jgi:hypothetical protein
MLYFPERWLSPMEVLGMMQAFCDLHEDHPLRYVYVITGDMAIVSDFSHDMVRLAKETL